jgi:hypothetical protein
MIDLFRFVTLRSPKVPDPNSIVEIAPSPSLQQQFGQMLNPTTPAAVITARARELLAGWGGVIKTTSQLAYGTQYPLFITAIDADPPVAPTSQLVKQIFGLDPQQLIIANGFVGDRAAVCDTLLLVKLASDGTQVDVAGLNRVLRATAVIASLAAGDPKPTLNPIFVFASLPLRREQAQNRAVAGPAVTHDAAAAIAHDNARAIQVLAAIPPIQLTSTQLPAIPPPATRAKRDVGAGPTENTVAAISTGSAAVLAIAPALAKTLDPAVARVAKRLNLDFTTMSVPQLIHAITASANGSATLSAPKPDDAPPTDPEADPGTPSSLPSLPTAPASVVTPIGIGDLLVVKQRLKRYEAADIAYIENVLRTESFKRDTRRLDRTQTTVTTETDVTTEEQRDTQATERFSLQRESANTIKEDSSLKAGLAVSASYGPTVSVKANVDTASSSSHEDSVKQATSYSKDVTTRAATKVTQTTKQIQTMLTLNEYEEDIHHGFDNTTGASNVSGVYQWVNKVYEAQIYNYGQRLMFDVMVPEPAAFLISQLRGQAKAAAPTPPRPLTVKPEDINDFFPGDPNHYYQTIAAIYGTTSLDPSPELFQTIDLKFAFDNLDPSKPKAAADEFKIPDGYQAYSVNCVRDTVGAAGTVRSFAISVGAQFIADGPHPMAYEIGTIPVSLRADDSTAITANIELTCVRTARAYSVWQEKVYAAIAQSYQRLQDEYQKAVSDAGTTQGVSIPGQNPELNRILVQNELKKGCISLVTGQQYEAFGAIELSASENYPEVLLANAEVQGKYVRFLEEAFEWEQMTYLFYPYYWGRKGRWPLHVLKTDPDPQFSTFLNAGCARVAFPVRPGFEEAVLHMLETGEIYNGGDFPSVKSNLYKPIAAELREQQGAPGAEKPQGDPWEVTLPTTLVKLRSDDKLPSWGWDKSTPPQWVELV